MFSSLLIYAGLAIVVGLVLVAVRIVWRRRRNPENEEQNPGNEELLSEMATHLWGLPPPVPPPEVAPPLEEVELSPFEERPASAGDALKARATGSHHPRRKTVGANTSLPGIQPLPSEAVERSIEEARRPVPQVATGEPIESIKRELHGVASDLVEQTRHRLEEEVVSALETFSRQAEGRLRALEEGDLQQWASKLQAQAAEQTQQRIDDFREGRHPSLQLLLQEVEKQLDVAGSRLVEQTQGRLQTEVSLALETFSQEVSARLRAFQEDQVMQLMTKLRSEIAEHVQEQFSNIENAADETRQQVSLLAGRIAPLLDNRELLLRSAHAGEGGQDARQHAEAAIGKIDLAVETTAERMQAFESRMAARFAELVDGLQKTSDSLTASSASRLEGQVEAVTERAKSELHALQTRIVDEANRQLAAVIQTTHESLTAKAETITEELRGRLGNEIEEQLRVDVHRSVQELEANCKGLMEKQRQSVQRLFDEQRAAATQAFLGSLQRDGQAMIDECRGRIHHEVDAAVRASVPELEAAYENLPTKSHTPPLMAVGFGPPGLRGESPKPRERPAQLAAIVRSTLRAAVWVIPVAPILVIVALSIRPVTYLRTDPPTEFFAGLPDSPTAQRATEERIGRAYWDSAVRYVQPKYGFGSDLPDQPLPEFRVEETRARGKSSKSDSDIRERYWRNLRQVWTLPQAWEKSYMWDTGWIDTTLAIVQRVGRQLLGGAD